MALLFTNKSHILPDEFMNNFDKFMNNENQGNLELEVRFGYFENDKFVSSLPDISLYSSIIFHLDQLVLNHTLDVCSYKSCRLVETYNYKYRKITDLNTNKVTYQQKNKVYIIDNIEWGLRFCKAYEVEISEINPAFTQKRFVNRITYIDTRPNSFFYGFKIDVSEISKNNDIHYELELEVLKGHKPTLEKWYGAIQTLYGWTLNATDKSQIISLEERYFVRNQINVLILRSITPKLNIHSIVNRPKTLLNIQSIKNHLMSLKIDGINKILIINTLGTYLCSDDLNINREGNAGDSAYIIEGEFLPKQRKYIAFDILVYQNKIITMLSFMERYKLLNTIQWPKSFIDIQIKKIWHPDQIDDFMCEYNKSTIACDGIIFHPIQDYGNGLIWKWKPKHLLTIDFVVFKENDKYIPHVLGKDKYIRYGDREVIGFLEKEFDGEIVECKWSNTHWTPIRIRSDKLYPNSPKVANINMNMINNPIEIEDIVNFLKSK